jgi:hypothetical protein
MKLWTYAEARDKIEQELDIKEEKFITPEELLHIFNCAIDEAEAEVHNLFESYFLCEKTYELIKGQDRYPMPTDIYANKIKYLWFNDGIMRYQIKRLRDSIIPFADIPDIGYSFQIQHRDSTEGITLKLNPSVMHSGPHLHMQYIRNANRLFSDSDVIDIPEAMGFIFAYVKQEVYVKESNPLLQIAMAKVESQRALMQTTLKSMTVDDDNEIAPDMSFYFDLN